MKTVTISQEAAEVNVLLDRARDDDLLVRAADGTQFMIAAVDDFDEEVALTRRKARLMALLDERARQTQTVPLEDVKRELGLTP